MCHLQTILFTMDDDILELVASNDQTFEVDAMDELCTSDDVCDRPSTADGRDVVSYLCGFTDLLYAVMGFTDHAAGVSDSTCGQ